MTIVGLFRVESGEEGYRKRAENGRKSRDTFLKAQWFSQKMRAAVKMLIAVRSDKSEPPLVTLLAGLS